MFERYTEKARRVIFFARYEASQFGAPYIETEHLLLGLLQEDKALAFRFFTQRSDYQSIRQEIQNVTPLREPVSTSVDMPLSNESKRILEYAAEEAERLSHRHIGTEHLLLGILREEDCFATELLKKQGLSLSAIREELSKHPQPSAGTGGGSAVGGGRTGLRAVAGATPWPSMEFINDADGKQILAGRNIRLPFLPRTGDELVFGSSSFRVMRVIYMYKEIPNEEDRQLSLPEKIVIHLEPISTEHKS
jgi:Clp amino terminal domain, pathogenicity island component